MSTRDRDPDAKSTSRQWHAVSIRPGRPACAAAKAAKGQRWLSKDAPRLPLPDCGQPGACQCTYQHHGDRRSGEGRRAEENDMFRIPAPPAEGNRRTGRNRRRSGGD